MKFKQIIAAFIILCSACGNDSDDKETIRKDIGDFATFYFNYNFHDALRFCTPESKPWISFIASNIGEEDLEVLRSQEEGAVADIEEISINSDDSTAVVTVRVENYMKLDTIGHCGTMEKEGIFHLPVVKREKRWLVKMEDLQRSGM